MKFLYQKPFIIIIVLITDCAPYVRTNLSKSLSPLDYKQEIPVLDIGENIPEGAELLGNVKIGDAGFSVNCGYDVVIEKAKNEARKAGGNLIKLTEHNPPGMSSSCHSISAKILHLDPDVLSKYKSSRKSEIDSSLDYALLHVYRKGSYGAILGYDLYLGDSVICRVKANCKYTLRIKKEGWISIWAKTESKTEIPFNMKIGKEYFLNCGVKMGILIGRPTLEFVDKEQGRIEFQTIKDNKR